MGDAVMLTVHPILLVIAIAFGAWAAFEDLKVQWTQRNNNER